MNTAIRLAKGVKIYATESKISCPNPTRAFLITPGKMAENPAKTIITIVVVKNRLGVPRKNLNQSLNRLSPFIFRT